MNNADILQFAREAGFCFDKYGLLRCGDDGEVDADHMFVRFAEMILAAKPVAVPEGFVLPERKLAPEVRYESEQERQNDAAYRAGWNQCIRNIEIILAAAPKPEQEPKK